MKKNLDYTYPKVKSLTKEIINRYINIPYKLYIFGSFARGEALPYSDLDIALETEKEMYETQIRKIKYEIDNIKTLKKIDFIYLNKSSEDMKNLVKKEGVLIYGFGR